MTQLPMPQKRVGSVRAARSVVLLLLPAALSLSACGGQKPPRSEAAESAPYPVTTIKSLAGVDEQRIEGRLEGFEQTTVLAQVAGEVLEIRETVGSPVKGGALLMRVRATGQQGSLAQAQAMLREARAREVEVAARYQRIAGLYERQVVPRAVFDEATAARESAAAQLSAAQAQLAAVEAYTNIRAPFDGVVVARHVTVGAQVMPGMPLLGLATTDRLRVTASVPASYAQSLQASEAIFLVRGATRIALANWRVAPSVGLQSGAFVLQADIPPGQAGLVPGMIVTLAVSAGERAQFRVPAASVVERGEVIGVYVYDPGSDRTSFRQLRLGRAIDTDIEVLAGLREGDQVASEPSAALQHLAGQRR